MNPQPEAGEETQWLIQRCRLPAGCLATIRRQLSQLFKKSPKHILQPLFGDLYRRVKILEGAPCGLVAQLGLS